MSGCFDFPGYANPVVQTHCTKYTVLVDCQYDANERLKIAKQVSCCEERLVLRRFTKKHQRHKYMGFHNNYNQPTRPQTSTSTLPCIGQTDGTDGRTRTWGQECRGEYTFHLSTQPVLHKSQHRRSLTTAHLRVASQEVAHQANDFYTKWKRLSAERSP